MGSVLNVDLQTWGGGNSCGIACRCDRCVCVFVYVCVLMCIYPALELPAWCRFIFIDTHSLKSVCVGTGGDLFLT